LNKDRPNLNPKSCIDSSVSLSRNESDDNPKDFEMDNRKEVLYERIGRNHTKKHENKEVKANLDNQNRKKRSKHNKTNPFENIIQEWLEKQETRQIEADKKKEEQRLELLQMKQQNDMMLFGLLNNLTNCLSSLHGKSNTQSNTQSGSNSYMNQGIIMIFVTHYTSNSIYTLYVTQYTLRVTRSNSNLIEILYILIYLQIIYLNSLQIFKLLYHLLHS
jgi:hypothetical protein